VTYPYPLNAGLKRGLERPRIIVDKFAGDSGGCIRVSPRPSFIDRAVDGLAPGKKKRPLATLTPRGDLVQIKWNNITNHPGHLVTSLLII